MTRTIPVFAQPDDVASQPEAPSALSSESNSSGDPSPTTFPARTSNDPFAYAKPFCNFLNSNPTVFHAVSDVAVELERSGFTHLSGREPWTGLKAGQSYYTTRNGSSLIAFTVGSSYKPGNGVAMIAGHVDALTVRLKPVSKLEPKAGYAQLGVAPYAGGLNETWWDRDLGIAGRVVVKGDDGKITERLVDLHEPIARVPTLAPHFGAAAAGPFNLETQAVPIIGLDGPSNYGSRDDNTARADNSAEGGAGTFASTQPPKLVKAISKQLDIQDVSKIVSWELELYDVQPATIGGLEQDLIYAGRVDDKLCSWSAIVGLLESTSSKKTDNSSIIKCVGLFDDEEIGSLLRQGARGNFLPGTIQRIVESFTEDGKLPPMGQTYANSFLVSADVTHAVNPNFLNAYLHNHAPELNVGVTISADSNGHMTTDAVSTALLQRVADKCRCKLQVFQIRNDSRSGGTVGPMLSSAMGVRAVDAGIPQLSMHSIRATTGALDPGLGAKMFKGFFDHYEEVDKEFQAH